MDGWAAQQEHLQTHNLFYSAVFGEFDTGIVDIGFNVVGEFMRLIDPRSDVDVEPPYTVFNGEAVVFFDFLTPGMIRDRDVGRISKYNKIGLETVQNHLKRVNLPESFDHNDVKVFDHCTVCRKTQYHDYSTGNAEKRQIIERLQQESCVATVSSGDQLSIESGELHDKDLSRLLKTGIEVPETPANLIYLPRVIKKELLAVGICEEIVLGCDLRDGGVAFDYQDIRQHFGRHIPYDVIEEVFEFLRSVNACRKRRDDGKYRFTKYTLSNIMQVRHLLLDSTVDDYLNGDDSINRRIDEFP